ncbi:MAG TPA: sensor histidine kinase [Pseudonocardiaceae bacterium]|jgi:two-component system sensor histidine kinase DesK
MTGQGIGDGQPTPAGMEPVGVGLIGSKPWFGRRPGIWRLVAGAFTLWLVPSALAGWHSDRPLWLRVLICVLLAGYAAAYLGLLPWGPSTGRRGWFGYGCVLALGLVSVVLLGPSEIGLLMFALIAGAAVLPIGWAFAVSGVILGGMLLATALSPSGPQYGEVIVFGSITWMVIMLISLARTVRQLRAVREEVARLAVADERVRIARDLHDVLGHSLTTITVKAGLARRLLEDGAVARAAAEVADVERLGRQALTEVRATVSAHRVASLAAEIAGARVALTAAGIRAELPHAVDDVDPAYQEAFAYVLREGVTNVLRHSGARCCHVRLGSSWLEVRDDGQGSAPNGTGQGLAGLRERLAPLGGTVQAAALSGGGFRLRAAVGVPGSAPESGPESMPGGRL